MLRPQDGGTRDASEETLFGAITYVLVNTCTWRPLSPGFSMWLSNLSDACGELIEPVLTPWRAEQRRHTWTPASHPSPIYARS